MASESVFATSKTCAELSELRTLLFVNLDIPIDKVQQYLQDMEAHPDKILQYRKLLTKKLGKTVTNYKEKNVGEITEIALARTDLWKAISGLLPLQSWQP